MIATASFDKESETYCNKENFHSRKLLLDDLLKCNKLSQSDIESLTFPIYMDYQATTKPDPIVVEEMFKCYSQFANSHSRNHQFGWDAKKIVEEGRKIIQDAINASNSKEIIFTSGATESSNLAIKGLAEFYGKPINLSDGKESRGHFVTSSIEHKCGIDSFRYLAEQGFDVTYLPVQSNGIIDIDELDKSIQDNTIAVSIMMANNEIGTVQPVKEIGKLCRKRGVFFHTDAAQAFGRLPIDVEDMNIDLLSISGHKIYGPMGIGALYVRKTKGQRVRMKPLFSGGGQEYGTRSGTVPTALVAGLGKATEIALKNMEKDNAHMIELRDLLYNEIISEFPDTVLNGDPVHRLPNNLNISFPYVEGESIIIYIKDVAVSSGSACTSASLEPSYVLRSLGVADELAHSSIRFGIGKFTTKAEVIFVAELVKKKIKKLRSMSPLLELVEEGVDLSTIEWSAH